MRARSVVLISLTILITASISTSFLLSPIDDLWVENPFWNGLSEVQASLHPNRITGVDYADQLQRNSTILMLGPTLPFTETEITSIKNYLGEGGRILLTDDFGTGNTLLEGLGLLARFSGELLQDNLYKDKKMMPRILQIEDRPETIGVDEIVFNYPTILTGVGEDETLAYASYFSEVTGSETLGPFATLAKINVGKGSLILISDSSTFINGMLERGDNKILLENSVKGSAYIDETHSARSRLAELRATLTTGYAFLNHPEIKYSLLVAVLVGVFKVAWEDKEEQIDEVEETLKRHPEWSRRELEELREARRRAHGEQHNTG